VFGILQSELCIFDGRGQSAREKQGHTLFNEAADSRAMRRGLSRKAEADILDIQVTGAEALGQDQAERQHAGPML
jgi:hypothetical protein